MDLERGNENEYEEEKKETTQSLIYVRENHENLPWLFLSPERQQLRVGRPLHALNYDMHSSSDNLILLTGKKRETNKKKRMRRLQLKKRGSFDHENLQIHNRSPGGNLCQIIDNARNLLHLSVG